MHVKNIIIRLILTHFETCPGADFGPEGGTPPILGGSFCPPRGADTQAVKKGEKPPFLIQK